MSKKPSEFRRPQAAALAERLAEPRRFETLLVGDDGIALEDFLNRPVAEWLAH